MSRQELQQNCEVSKGWDKVVPDSVPMSSSPSMILKLDSYSILASSPIFDDVDI